jgi:hypothetical protein
MDAQTISFEFKGFWFSPRAQADASLVCAFTLSHLPKPLECLHQLPVAHVVCTIATYVGVGLLVQFIGFGPRCFEYDEHSAPFAPREFFDHFHTRRIDEQSLRWVSGSAGRHLNQTAAFRTSPLIPCQRILNVENRLAAGACDSNWHGKDDPEAWAKWSRE